MKKKKIRRRWLVMQVMDASGGIAIGYPQLRRVMIFGPTSPYDGTSTCCNVPYDVLYLTYTFTPSQDFPPRVAHHDITRCIILWASTGKSQGQDLN